MKIEDITDNRSLKPKEKVEAISRLLLDNLITIEELIATSQVAKEPVKAVCIEALEYATRERPSIATSECLRLVSAALTEKAPRIKWESAKVIGNIAHLFPSQLDEALANLLANTEHTGTVVRWSAAYAIGEILKQESRHNTELVHAAEAICKREEKNSIRKLYMEALKKVKSADGSKLRNK
jgi:HEAT repeat protein